MFTPEGAPESAVETTKRDLFGTASRRPRWRAPGIAGVAPECAAQLTEQDLFGASQTLIAHSGGRAGDAMQMTEQDIYGTASRRPRW